jgi:diguanylate cyclase (GGDEF)-like protein
MHILIVDDSAALRRLIRHFLLKGGFTEVSEAASAEETYEFLGLQNPNGARGASVELILMDIYLPGNSGIDACRRIKSDPRFRDVPIAMITASSDMELLEQSFEAGASEFITKPIHPVELLSRLRSIGRLKREMERRKERERELLKVKLELEIANRSLERLSCLDGLTGIANRRHFDMTLKREWDRAQRHQNPLSLALVDIDHFKKFNDAYGHLRGDACLSAVARTLEVTAKRGSDLVARYGGEEFAVVLPDLDYDRALEMGRLLNQAITILQMEHNASDVSPVVTVSVGVATAVPSEDQAPRLLVDQADRALYRSKRAGRNRITHARDIADVPADSGR